MTPEHPTSARELLALLAEYETGNGEKLDFMIRRDWMEHLAMLRAELRADLAALTVGGEAGLAERKSRLRDVLGT